MICHKTQLNQTCPLNFIFSDLIGHCSYQVLSTASSVHTDLMNIRFCCWPTMVCSYVRVHGTYEFIFTPPAVPSMSCSFYLNAVSGRYCYCFVGWCFQDLSRVACSILVYFSCSFLSKGFVKIQVVQSYNSTNIATV